MPTLREALRSHLAGTTPAIGFLPIARSPGTCDTDSTPSPLGPIYLVETPVESSIIPASAGPFGASPPAIAEDRYASLIDPQNPVPAPLTPAEVDQIQGYLEESQAAATREAYRSDLADFARWCAELGLCPLPAEPATVTRYLVARAETLKVSTLTRRLSAISQAHQARNLDSPTASLIVRKVFAGIRRVRGADQQGKAPLLPDDLKLMVAQLDDSPAGRRDRALLLVGFAGAFRRSELVSLQLADLQFRREGIIATLRRSKTDQEGEGLLKGLPRGRDKALCPVRAVEAWLKAAAIVEGPLFRAIDRHGNLSDEALADFHVVRVIKRLTAAIGLDPDDYGGHSLRAGLATAAAAAGKHERDIMKQTGHKSVAMVRKYIRPTELFQGNAADGLL